MYTLLVDNTKSKLIYFYKVSVVHNVLKPDPDTEPDDLPGHWVIGSTAGEPRVNR